MTDAAVPPPSRRRGLGRGLEALLTNSGAGGGHPADSPLIEVDPDQVQANPEQPRRHFDDEELRALAESIRLHGLLHPIVVERSGAGFRLVAGERRLRAARLGGLAALPAIVRPPADSAREALELALTENLLRANLSPMEEAAAYARLSDTFGLSHEAIALRLGRSRSAVSNTIRLLALPAPVQQAIADGRISAGHARALLGLNSSADQAELARRIENQGLTVRDAERAVQGRLDRSPVDRPGGRGGRPTAADPDDLALRRGLETVLGAPVRLERRGVAPRVIISLASDEDLHALYRRLGGPGL
ncbi:MAG: ParB/RepB/Spo0J family partition protein [Candidatus Dormibacteria bacterium]